VGAIIGFVAAYIAKADAPLRLTMSFMGAFYGGMVGWKHLREFGQALIERLRTHGVPIGTGLIIAGVGLLLGKLPETITTLGR
jgi:hypothetical protein